MSRRRNSKKTKSRLEKNLPNLHFQTMCLGKKIFWTASAANFKALKITNGGKPMRSYNCPNCLQWHLTSQVDQQSTKKTNIDEYTNVSTTSAG